MTLKLLGIAAVISSAAALGFLKAHRLKVRMDSLGGFIKAVNFLQREVEFMKNGMYRAFLNTAGLGILSDFFTKAAGGMKERKLEEAWETAVKECSKDLALEKSDTEIILLIGKTLGKSDSKHESGALSNAVKLLEEQYKDASERYVRDSSLYRNTGMIIGAAAAILLF